ncbi:hypothetical protein [Aureispira anguillae]|uniref:Uncharacterized protein n=1 Tax=Aureispira anguillae TaxID=2864201 RepID=A0A915YGF4_9BACT|nr:hypothetical protein [Aureispira anguillae]BDS12570.1 hypothetical protein AsAng_0032930 [Aureispira anguillae]
MDREIHILDAPSFLDGIPAFVLGFGGAFLIVLLFIAFHKYKIGYGASLGLALFIYACSIGTGIGLTGPLEDRTAAFVAGFWSPTIYSLMITVLVRIFYKGPKKESSNYDHLIGS